MCRISILLCKHQNAYSDIKKTKYTTTEKIKLGLISSYDVRNGPILKEVNRYVSNSCPTDLTV